MQYELAKLLLPIVLASGGYDADPQSVAECRDTIDVQRRANEKSHIDYFFYEAIWINGFSKK